MYALLQRPMLTATAASTYLYITECKKFLPRMFCDMCFGEILVLKNLPWRIVWHTPHGCKACALFDGDRILAA